MYLPLQYGESVGVADWFQSFCAVFHIPTGAAEAEEASPSSKPSRRRGKKQQQGSSQVNCLPAARPALPMSARSPSPQPCIKQLGMPHVEGNCQNAFGLRPGYFYSVRSK